MALITPKHAAEILGIDRKRVYALIDAGKITAYDYNQGEGNRWLMVEKSSVIAFLERSRIKPPPIITPRYAAI